MIVGITVQAISSLVLPWIGLPSDSSPGFALNFQSAYPNMTMTIAKTKHDRTIITSNSVSIGPRSTDAASPNQSNCSSTTELKAPITSIAATSLT